MGPETGVVDQATVFDIERYAVEDGPGIRTVVFFKGCNLHCAWCQNPESHSMKPQVMYYRDQCAACGKCVAACPVGAVQDSPPRGLLTDHEICTLCGSCVDACFHNARRIVGRRITVHAIMEEILKDRTFYENSGGGVTFSGGEPLLQTDAVLELGRRCRAEGIHTALETAGFIRWDLIERILPWLDLLYFDFKHVDSEMHRRVTGVPNELILENLRKAGESFENMVVRIPVIPGVNADMETLSRMFFYLVEQTRVRTVELLPFHRLGGGKYAGLGMEYAFEKVANLSKEDCLPFADAGRRLGLAVNVGAQST